MSSRYRRRGRFRRAAAIGPLVLFLGKITPRKGSTCWPARLHAAPRPEATLVIAGNDMGGVRGGASASRAAGCRDRLQPGSCGPPRLDALAAADVGGLPLGA